MDAAIEAAAGGGNALPTAVAPSTPGPGIPYRLRQAKRTADELFPIDGGREEKKPGRGLLFTDDHWLGF
jgi:hypothetical protein